MNKKYSACVAGLGRIGFTLGFDKKREQPASHTMALLNNSRIQIVAGCDIDKKRRDEWQMYVSKRQRKHTKVYDDIGKMLKENKADIVVLAVNEASHLHTALCAIEERPRLIILEKPVALNSAEGKRIRDSTLMYGVPVMINHERRFAYDYNMARKYIQDGNIGEVQSVTAEIESSLRVYSPSEDATGSYSLIHDGTHLVDITRFLLGDAALTDPLLVNIVRDKEDKKVVRNLSVHFKAESQEALNNGGKEVSPFSLDAALPLSCPDVLIKISGRSSFFNFCVEVLGTRGRVRIGNGFARFESREESRLYTGFYSLTPDKNIRLAKKTCYFANMVESAVGFLDGTMPMLSSLESGLIDLKVLEEMKVLCGTAQ